MISLKVRSPVTRTMSNSCARLTSKCSQSALLTSTPDFSSSVVISFLTSGRQEPQDVPALVHALTPPRSVQPCSVTAHRIAPADTLLQEQTPASSGRSAPGAGALPSGSSQAVGSEPRALPTIGRSEAYAVASPTSTPPSSVWASSDSTSFL